MLNVGGVVVGQAKKLLHLPNGTQLGPSNNISYLPRIHIPFPARHPMPQILHAIDAKLAFLTLGAQSVCTQAQEDFPKVH